MEETSVKIAGELLETIKLLKENPDLIEAKINNIEQRLDRLIDILSAKVLSPKEQQRVYTGVK